GHAWNGTGSGGTTRMRTGHLSPTRASSNACGTAQHGCQRDSLAVRCQQRVKPGASTVTASGGLTQARGVGLRQNDEPGLVEVSQAGPLSGLVVGCGFSIHLVSFAVAMCGQEVRYHESRRSVNRPASVLFPSRF